MAKEYHVGITRKLGNWFVTAMVRRGLGPANTYILTTMGRRSGQPRSTPVTIAESENRRYLVSPYGDVGWVKNVRARPVATVQRGGEQREVAVRAVEADEAAPVLRQYLTDLERVVGDFFDVPAAAPVEAFVEVADRHPVFRIE